MKRGSRKGVALVVVLALLVALGAVAAGVGEAVRLEAATVASLRARTVARYAAESGVVATEWRIQTLLDSVQSLPERAEVFRRPEEWLGPLAQAELATARYEVAVIDLNARLDLNRSDSVTVRRFLAQFTSESRAADIVAEIRSRPLYRVGELALIPGVDDALAAAAAPYVTVWGDGTVNLNSAPEPVLAALPGLGDAGARNVVERREGGEVFTSAESLQPRAAPLASPGTEDEEGNPSQETEPVFASAGLQLRVATSPTRFLVVSRGWQTGHPLTHEVQAVYAVMGARVSLQMWQERDL